MEIVVVDEEALALEVPPVKKLVGEFNVPFELNCVNAEFEPADPTTPPVDPPDDPPDTPPPPATLRIGLFPVTAA